MERRKTRKGKGCLFKRGTEYFSNLASCWSYFAFEFPIISCDWWYMFRN